MVDWDGLSWQRVIAAVLFIVSFVIYGSQPKVGAAADKLVSFYDGDSTQDSHCHDRLRLRDPVPDVVRSRARERAARCGHGRLGTAVIAPAQQSAPSTSSA